MLTTLALSLLLVQPANAAAEPETSEGNVLLARQPAVSPDGSRLLFTWRGDVWRVPAAGGEAVRLTSDPAEDVHPEWSTDGRTVAFASGRFGGQNLMLMAPDGRDVRRLTHTDRYLTPSGFDTENNLLAHAYLEGDPRRARRPYQINADGPGDVLRLTDAYGESPDVSPDGSKVVFVRGGEDWQRRGYAGPDTRDLWLHDRAAGTFHRLTDRPGNDGQPKFIDDATIAFLSDRATDGATAEVFTMTLDGNEPGEVRQLTPGAEGDVASFDVDGGTLVFERSGRLYRMPATGGDPEPILITASEDERDTVDYLDLARQVTEAALSPDGQTLAVVAYGQVLVRGTAENVPTRRVTDTLARHSNLAWSPDGGTLYFVGDETGVEAIYAATVSLTRDEIRNPPTAPTAAEPEEEPAEQSATMPATRPAATTLPDDDDVGVQPAKTVAGAPSTRPAEEVAGGGRVGDGYAVPDPAKWADALDFDVRPAIETPDGASLPTPSPDGTKLAWKRGLGDLVVRDLATGDDTLILDHWSMGLEFQWVPDGGHLLYATEDRNHNTDIWAIPAEGGEAINLTKHPDNDGDLSISADGKLLAFVSERKDEQYDVFRVWLDESMETRTAAELDEYFEEAAKAVKESEPPAVPAFMLPPEPEPDEEEPATQPSTQPATQPATRPAVDADAEEETEPEEPAGPMLVTDELDDVYLRLQRVTDTADDDFDATLTPAGDTVVFERDGAVHTIDRDGELKTLGDGDLQHLTRDGTKAVVVDDMQAKLYPLGSGKPETLATPYRLTLDLAEKNERKFLEAARIVGRVFYDPQMKGLDWPALTRRMLPLARAARTAGEFDDVASRLVGHLNASHLGVYSPPRRNPDAQTLGRLGATTGRADNGYAVTAVLPEGPAGKEDALQVGDVITAVDLALLDETTTLDRELLGKAGDEVLLDVTRDGEAVRVLLTPVDFNALRDLRYDQWQLDRRAEVEAMSGGRLGYIHIRGMNQGALDDFERDLYAAAEGRDGLVIDVRSNGGGWTTDRLLASIMYPRHAYTIPRGMTEGGDTDDSAAYPQDRLFIQRYDLPINMLADEKSFSNAEIAAHAFKTLGRGTLVGKQTAGGVISTGGATLLDGTRVRTPFRGWYLPDGTDMEHNGAIPDLEIDLTPADEAAGEDPQLEVAVDDLMKRLD